MRAYWATETRSQRSDGKCQISTDGWHCDPVADEFSADDSPEHVDL